MALKQYRVITRFLAVSLALLITVQAGACGWGDDYETMRLAFFKADTPGMQKYKPAYYTENYLNRETIDSDADRQRNCAEWQRKLGGKVSVADIYTIQYDTEPEEFKNYCDAGQLGIGYKGNTFTKALLKPQNKALLQYLIFAKEMEYEGGTSSTSWESWDEDGPVYEWNRDDTDTDSIPNDYTRFVPIEKRLANCTDRFLQERYAFMLIRYGNKDNVAALYNRYFENDTTATVLKPWAMLFRAYAAKDKAEQNYYLSRCFDLCEEKVIAVLQWYNFDIKEPTLKWAKNDHEKAVIIAIHAMRNPGPVFNDIKEVNRLAPGSEYVNLLIGREVNKFEDWLFYTQMQDNSPDAYSDPWGGNDSYMQARFKNYRKDIAYLRSFREYLKSVYSKAAAGSNHDFLAAALAHLSFIDDRLDDGYNYASAISATAPPTILVQKYTELALVAAKQGDINNPAIKQKLYDALNRLQEISITDPSYSKSQHTLLKILAAEYNKKGDIATANLLFLKSENYKHGDYGFDYASGSGNEFTYPYLGYLDRYAQCEDMDHLIALIDKKDKTPFEKFICNGTITTKEAYIDLKGKIAFRQNNLKLAYETFKRIPDSIAAKIEPYSLDSLDPFYPKILYYVTPESKEVKPFTKAGFVKEILSLQTKTDVNSYMKLGHAYYNTSYMGNSWFMDAYYQGHVGWEVSFGNLYENKVLYNSGNYANLTIAHSYYLKAFKAAANDEQRALAALMLHVCERYGDYGYRYSWEEKKTHKPSPWIEAFYGKYKKTETFKRYSCPELEWYLK